MRTINIIFIFIIGITINSCFKTSSSNINSLYQSDHEFYIYGYEVYNNDGYICQYKCPSLSMSYKCKKYYTREDSSTGDAIAFNMIRKPISYMTKKIPVNLSNIESLLNINTEEDTLGICKYSPYISSNNEKFLLLVENLLYISHNEYTGNEIWDKYKVSNNKNTDEVFHYKKVEDKNKFIFISTPNKANTFVPPSISIVLTPCYPFYPGSETQKILLKAIKDINSNLEYLDLKQDSCLPIYPDKKTCLSLTYGGITNTPIDNTSSYIITCNTSNDFILTKTLNYFLDKQDIKFIKLSPKE